MKDKKKNEFWATSVRRFIDDGSQKFNEIGLIYLNLRDMEDKNKIIDALIHELGHLIDNKSDYRKIKKEMLLLKQ